VTKERHLLPGADDPRYVQTDAVWSPDGKYLVFARAKAMDPYPPDGKMAEHANDPIEVQVKYDLYRIPFNGGKGGVAEPIEGASNNGMSNNFPKISPDGRWIVFVKNRNGQLMRPDSELYILPVAGGVPRRLRSNTSRMNSWHSFSPNGRWLVFSSKARSVYTQMYLTHIDEEGNDSPAILIDNSTAANRAVNLPEFVNIPPDGLVKISTPAVDMYNRLDLAVEKGMKGDIGGAIARLEKPGRRIPRRCADPIQAGRGAG
jgi:Tol biopolymer transport system component